MKTIFTDLAGVLACAALLSFPFVIHFYRM
jgi:hypothetical protein